MIRYFECPYYTSCLDAAAKSNKRNFDCSGCQKVSNNLKPQKVEEIKAAIIDGDSLREVASKVGVSKVTVSKIRKIALIEHKEVVLCKCGKPAGHKGWCQERLLDSPKRMAFLQNQWGKFGKTKFRDIALKYQEYLGKRQIELKKQIEDLMVEHNKNVCEITGLCEYLSFSDFENDKREGFIESYLELLELEKEDSSKLE